MRSASHRFVLLLKLQNIFPIYLQIYLSIYHLSKLVTDFVIKTYWLYPKSPDNWQFINNAHKGESSQWTISEKNTITKLASALSMKFR